MNNNGITYFRLNSPYQGDITKDCALKGNEVDNNFFILEGRDIKSVYVEDDKIKIELINGKVISSDTVFDTYTKDLSFKFDSENGILYIIRNGVETKIDGFKTEFNIDQKPVASDDSLSGNGKPSNPLKLARQYRTGQYSPVKKFIDRTQNQSLPEKDKNIVGDRYIVLDNVSDYGLLYNYDGVKRIACDLIGENSAWRIPTKEDWDDMLNAIEPNDDNKTHEGATCNKYFGRFAGKLIKSTNGWRLEKTKGDDTCIDYSDSACGKCTCGKPIQCSPTYCGEYGTCCHKPLGNDNEGVDKYGFRAMPAGYSDDGGNVNYFGERAYFWTATNANCGNSAFMKRLEYNKSAVYQDVEASSNSFSVRLVKDYNGSNYLEKEEILGDEISTVLMPSVKKGYAIWTKVNVNFNDKVYHPIVPNLGQNITSTRKYYIYEWDGQRWLIKSLSEGDHVVILDSPDGKYAYEYEINNGDLIGTTQKISDAVYEKVNENVTELGKKLDKEIDRATTKENELSDSVDKVNETVNKVSDKLEAEIQERKETDAKIQTDLATVNTNLVTAINTINKNVSDGFNTINGGIEAERQIRASKDEELEDKIKDVSDKATELDSKLDTEISDRKEADETEKSERQSKDDELERKIDENKKSTDEAIADEKTQREEKDTEIEGKLIKQDETEFDSQTGILTLKSNDGTNDIKVQFTFDFGNV